MLSMHTTIRDNKEEEEEEEEVLSLTIRWGPNGTVN